MKKITERANVKSQKVEVEKCTINNLQIIFNFKNCFLLFTGLSQIDARMPTQKFKPQNVLFRCT